MDADQDLARGSTNRVAVDGRSGPDAPRLIGHSDRNVRLFACAQRTIEEYEQRYRRAVLITDRRKLADLAVALVTFRYPEAYEAESTPLVPQVAPDVDTGSGCSNPKV